jgi:hypothetical protein
MFERVNEAIDDWEIPVDGAALAAGFAVLDRVVAKVAAAVGEFDSAELWDCDGASSMVAWLRHHAGRSGRDAQVVTRTARRLGRLPVTAAAFAAGDLSGGQMQAIVAHVDERTVELFAEHEPEVVPALVGLSVSDTAAAMGHWARYADSLLDEPPTDEPERALFLSRTLDGRRELSGHLDAEGGEIVSTALRLAQTPEVVGEPARSPARRRADGLVDVCRWFLEHQGHRRGGRHRPHLNVIVDLEALEGQGRGQLVDGSLLRPVDVQRLLCDAGVHRVVTAGRSTVLDYGTTTRTIPAPLWAALVVRDGHCRFPGCDRPPEWCEGHHLRFVSDGGPTRLDNLAMLCSRHHHICHCPGWQAKLLPDATLEVTTPDGRVMSSRPPPAISAGFAA